MKHHSHLLQLGILATGVFISHHADAQKFDRPNIIFFLVDDMGFMDCTVNGSKYYETPNMERLARQGKLFTNAFAAHPFCSPTRASIITGCSPERFHITMPDGHTPANPEAPFIKEKDFAWKKMIDPIPRSFLPLEAVTLGQKLKEVGYTTAHFGKWHLGLTKEYRPENRGFDVVFGMSPDPGPGTYFSPYGVHPDGKPSFTPSYMVGNVTDGPTGEYITDRLTNEAITYIEKHKNSPFYLNLWHYAVHEPWEAQLSLYNKFKDKKDPRGKQNCAIMAAMIKSMDSSLGKIMDKLEELGLSKKTIIVFYSDNGGNTSTLFNGMTPTNNYPYRNGKGDIHDGGVRVPCIISWPGRITPNSVSKELVSSYDFFPTLAALTGATIDTINHPIEGESILPLLFDKGSMKRTEIFTHMPHYIPNSGNLPSTSIRTKNWKLIRLYGEGKELKPAFELYKIKKDISESRNLADKNPKIVKSLDALIEAHLLRTNATIPIPNPAYNPDAKSPMGIKRDYPSNRVIAR
jgi:arylsulfatase A-like enzyme